SFSFFLLIFRPPPISTLFPYTTLFRSARSLEAPTSAMRRLGLRWLLRRKLQGHAHSPNAFQAMGTLVLRVFHKIRFLLAGPRSRSEEHTSELQSLRHLVCRLLLEKKKN